MSDVYNLGIFLYLKFSVHSNREGETAVCLAMLHMYLFYGATAPIGPEHSNFRGFTITDTLHSVGLLWTSDQPVAETSARDSTHHLQETDLHPPVRFEPAIPASEWSQTHPSDRGATGIGFGVRALSCVCVCVC
jgi:hypothetical protein